MRIDIANIDMVSEVNMVSTRSELNQTSEIGTLCACPLEFSRGGEGVSDSYRCSFLFHARARDGERRVTYVEYVDEYVDELETSC